MSLRKLSTMWKKEQKGKKRQVMFNTCEPEPHPERDGTVLLTHPWFYCIHYQCEGLVHLENQLSVQIHKGCFRLPRADLAPWEVAAHTAYWEVVLFRRNGQSRPAGSPGLF